MTIPYLEEEGTTTSIRFSGEINYEITYEADSDNTYRADDRLFHRAKRPPGAAGFHTGERLSPRSQLRVPR